MRSSSPPASARARRSCARDVCARLAFLGVELDLQANASAEPDVDVSASGSGVRVWVVRAREDVVAARAARSIV